MGALRKTQLTQQQWKRCRKLTFAPVIIRYRNWLLRFETPFWGRGQLGIWHKLKTFLECPKQDTRSITLSPFDVYCCPESWTVSPHAHINELSKHENCKSSWCGKMAWLSNSWSCSNRLQIRAKCRQDQLQNVGETRFVLMWRDLCLDGLLEIRRNCCTEKSWIRARRRQEHWPKRIENAFRSNT